MKPIVWKEWRENAKWAVLAFVFLSFALRWFALDHYRDYPPYNDYDSDLYQRLASFVMLLVPLYASALGFLQIVPELRRDQWAFLLHRPLARNTIFLGKVVAGLTLYFLVTLPPLVFLTVWYGRPGTVAIPFDARLMLPAFASVLMGVTFYFAAILATLGPTRCRLFGFAMAIAGCFFVCMAFEFWQAILVALFAISLTGFAAWGSFLKGDEYTRQPRLAKIGLGGASYLGLGALGTGLSISASIYLSTYTRRQSFENYYYSNYRITNLGRILRVRYKIGIPIEAYDLQGRLIARSKGNLEKELSLLDQYSSTLIAGNGQIQGNYRPYSSTDRYFLPLTNYGETGWFWVNNQNRAVNYSPNDRLPDGVLGPQGYLAQGRTGATSFPEKLLSNEEGLLRFARSVYILDTRQKRTLKLYTASSDDEIQNVASLNNGLVTVVAKKRIHFFNREGQLVFSTPLENADAKGLSVFVRAAPAQDRFFLQYHADSKGTNTPEKSYIAEVSAQGTVLKRTSLPPITDDTKFDPRREPWYQMAFLAAEMPPVVMGALLGYFHLTMPDLNYSAGMWATFRLVLGCALIVCFICSLLSLPLTRRWGLSKAAQWCWAAGVFVLGLFGLLMLLAICQWPTRVACPNCGKKRSVDQEKCEQCGAAFPAPPTDDTSIIEAPLLHSENIAYSDELAPIS